MSQQEKFWKGNFGKIILNVPPQKKRKKVQLYFSKKY